LWKIPSTDGGEFAVSIANIFNAAGTGNFTYARDDSDYTINIDATDADGGHGHLSQTIPASEVPLDALCLTPTPTPVPELCWTQVDTSGSLARDPSGMSYNSARGATVLFGGLDVGMGGEETLDDTLEWDGSSWTLSATGGPDSRLTATAYDSARGVT